jgi:hypothetical protein
LRAPVWPRTVDFYGWQTFLAHTSFGGEVKQSVPCHRFTACKRTLHSMSEMLCRPNFPHRFSPVTLLFRYQMALVVESGWFEWVCLGSRLATCSSFALI